MGIGLQSLAERDQRLIVASGLGAESAQVIQTKTWSGADWIACL